jgi:hypothetical protein
MKKVFTALIFSALVFFGCNQEPDITSPVGDNTIQEPNWLITLPPNGLGIETVYSASELIDGSKGGDVQLRGTFDGIKIDSRLHIHSDSFSGFLTISTHIDNVHCLTTFSPSFVFNTPLEYTLMFQELDLTGVNPDDVKFVYQAADGSIHECESDGVDVDLNKGKLKVNKAKIPHFSRYGFVN